MGDTPYTKEARYCLNKQLRDIDQSQMDFKFLAHVGDLKWGATKCYQSSFKDVAEIVSHAKNAKGYDTRDFFIVPGDNEFQDCQDQFTNGLAWKWFMKCKCWNSFDRLVLLTLYIAFVSHLHSSI